MKKTVILKTYYGMLKPGEYTFTNRVADYLISKGKAVLKEEKTVYQTKEEKFIPETKTFEDTPISKLDTAVMSTEDLKILLNDSRVSARKKAQKELEKR